MTDAIVIGSSLVLGLGVPLAFMALLVPSLAESHLVSNFRGRQVFPGLGIAWLVWAAVAVLGGVVGVRVRDGGSILSVLAPAGGLALAAFALGLVDDAYGTGRDRGFRGHLRALRGGRLTTGGLKLLGISVASYAAAFVLSDATGWTRGVLSRLLIALPAGAAIALTANFVNLTDLRPGRALKVYALIALLGVTSVAAGLVVAGSGGMRRLVDAFALLVFFAGPLLAVWRFDLGERGMLGDSGANAAGAAAGLLVVAGLPVWGVVGYLVLMLALNLASERFSFTRVIEGSAVLTRLDMLGRLPLEPVNAQPTESPQTESNPE